MSDNPYQAPQESAAAIGVRSGTREDLQSVARYQKGLLVCILVYLVAVIVQFALPPDLRWVLGLGVLALGIVGTVFVALLAAKVYNPGLAVLLGILVLVPCLGLIILLLVNSKATSVLKQNGIKVGLLGANLGDVY